MKDKLWSLVAKLCSKEPVKNWIIKHAKKTVYMHIPEDGSYMERYWILMEGSRLSKLLNLSIRLHIIKSPDLDRALHTHPFDFRTLIIEGGYTEIRGHHGQREYQTTTERKVGDSYELDKNMPHQILLLTDQKPCTTIFIYGEREQDWYFDTDRGLVPHATYLNEKNREV